MNYSACHSRNVEGDGKVGGAPAPSCVGVRAFWFTVGKKCEVVWEQLGKQENQRKGAMRAAQFMYPAKDHRLPA